MNHKIIIFLIIISVTLIFPSKYVFSSSEPLLITSSTVMDEIIFDGKWTFPLEWKYSSEKEFSYDDNSKIVLRFAHQENFIYLYVDSLNDFTFNEGADKATICFDGQNNKNIILDKDDFCFLATLGNNQGVVLQGNSNNTNTNFQKISNPKNFIGLGNISDENNRYNTTPHVSYEFKIPIGLIERSDNYGFYLSVYNADTDIFYTWPYESQSTDIYNISSPDHWGDIISPDKSLPELNLPLIVLMISILTIILIQSKTNTLMKRF